MKESNKFLAVMFSEALHRDSLYISTVLDAKEFRQISDVLVFGTTISIEDRPSFLKVRQMFPNVKYFKCKTIDKQKGFILKKAITYAYENSIDYVIMFNEGWYDSAEKVKAYISNEEYFENALSISVRNPNKINLGRLLNYLSNKLASFAMQHKVFDTKGDSINIFRVDKFLSSFSDRIFKLPDGKWYFWDILAQTIYFKEKVRFLTADHLETPGSPVRLNLIRFFELLRKSFYYRFFTKSYLKKNRSSLSFIEKNICTDVDLKHTEKSQKVNSRGLEKIKDNKVYIKKNVSGMSQLNITRLDHLNTRNKNVVAVNWCLTNICNYRCSYCPEDLHNGTMKGPELSDIKRFFFEIKQKHPKQEIFFEFTGGEVTYYREFLELIRFLKANGAKVGILSNGSRKISFWEKHHEFIDHICLSFHSEQGKPDHFYEVVSYLTDKITTHVNIMMKPENFEISYELAKKIAKDCEVSIAMQPLLENMDGALYNYTARQKEILDKQTLNTGGNKIFKRNPEFKNTVYRGAMLATYSDKSSTLFSTPELISNQLNSWKGWECYAGVENIVVNPEGVIYRGWCNVGGELGNVKDSKINLPKNPIICNKEQCSCGLDIMCTKVKV